MEDKDHSQAGPHRQGHSCGPLRMARKQFELSSQTLEDMSTSLSRHMSPVQELREQCLVWQPGPWSWQKLVVVMTDICRKHCNYEGSFPSTPHLSLASAGAEQPMECLHWC